MDRTFLLAGLLIVWAAAGWAQDKAPPLQVVPAVDLERYAGTWYEIARLPNWFQKKCAGEITATYTLLDDGTIRVLNRCREANGNMTEAEGRAKRAGGDGQNSKLKVRFAPKVLSFLPFVWGDYWIMELAEDYSHVAIGEPGRKYFWILARTPSLPENTIQEIVSRATEQGYDLNTLLRTRQENTP